MLDLVAYALELPVPARLVAREVARLEDLRAVLLLVLFGHAVEGELRDAELPVVERAHVRGRRAGYDERCVRVR